MQPMHCYGHLGGISCFNALTGNMFLSEGDINLVSKVILLVSRSEPTIAVATGHFFYIIIVFDLCCSLTLATPAEA